MRPPEGSRAWSGTEVLLGVPVTSDWAVVGDLRGALFGHLRHLPHLPRLRLSGRLAQHDESEMRRCRDVTSHVPPIRLASTTIGASASRWHEAFTSSSRPELRRHLGDRLAASSADKCVKTISSSGSRPCCIANRLAAARLDVSILL